MDARYTPPPIAERTSPRLPAAAAGCSFVPNPRDTADRQTEKLDDDQYAP
jgi:hypothetical protein